jgi:hypothetical protein
MECTICGQEKTQDKLKVFSYRAYTQILSMLKTNPETGDCPADQQKQSPIHVCMECLKGVYQLNNR